MSWGELGRVGCFELSLGESIPAQWMLWGSLRYGMAGYGTRWVMGRMTLVL